MFGLFKKKQRPPKNDGWTVWIAEPTHTDLCLVRRWGVITNTKVSSHQFNVYQNGNAFVVTMHFRDGKEVERDPTGLFKGGKCASIGDAWEAAASYTSDILNGSGMMGLPCQNAVIFDTTPGRDSFHLATFDYVNGAVQETRNFDPDSREPMACPVPPSQIGELQSARHHNAEQLSKVLDVAVYRMKSCPLASELLSEFPVRDQNFEGAKLRYVIFVSWCARRATIALSEAHRDQSMILGTMDALIQQQFEQLLGGDDKGFEFVIEAFGRFDQAFANVAKPGPTYWLGKAATSFIFGARFNGVDVKWMQRFLLPSNVLLQIHEDAKPIMVGLR